MEALILFNIKNVDWSIINHLTTIARTDVMEVFQVSPDGYYLSMRPIIGCIADVPRIGTVQSHHTHVGVCGVGRPPSSSHRKWLLAFTIGPICVQFLLSETWIAGLTLFSAWEISLDATKLKRKWIKLGAKYDHSCFCILLEKLNS